MSAEIKTRTTPLRTYKGILRALKWGWTVRCHLLKIQYPVGGVDLNVEDVRELDEDERDLMDDEFQVLTIQGWHVPTWVWAIRPDRRDAGRRAA